MIRIPELLPFLVHGTVTNSNGIVSGLAVLMVSNLTDSDVKTRAVIADSNGNYNYDLANQGYTQGDEISVNVSDKFFNEVKSETFIIEGGTKELNFSLEVRKDQVRSGGNTDLKLQNIGGKPVSSDNPLPVMIINSADIIDLVNNPEIVWTYSGNNFSPNTQTVTVRGVSYKRTFTYDAQRRVTKRSQWERIE